MGGRRGRLIRSAEMPFRSEKDPGAAAAEPPAGASYALAEGNGADESDELLARIKWLTAERRGSDDPAVDRELLALRHRAGLALMERPGTGAEHPPPDFEALGNGAGVPEVSRAELSPELLRAAILRHGCLLVRGLTDTYVAGQLRDEMDRAFAARAGGDDRDPSGYFEKFVPDPRYDLGPPRSVVSHRDAMWVADSPRLAAELLDVFERAGFLRLVTGYLGEHPAFSVNKSTLRRVTADSSPKIRVSFWHQDGAFMGEVRTLNVWLSLSRCGDVAPGLDVVPTRIDHVLPTGTEGAVFDWSVSQAVAEEAAGEVGISRPIFEPGDALLFDELFLHATASSPEMPDTRYAVECWFFGPSAFPAEYPPLAS
jgi:hypothetical protein